MGLFIPITASMILARALACGWVEQALSTATRTLSLSVRNRWTRASLLTGFGLPWSSRRMSSWALLPWPLKWTTWGLTSSRACTRSSGLTAQRETSSSESRYSEDRTLAVMRRISSSRLSFWVPAGLAARNRTLTLVIACRAVGPAPRGEIRHRRRTWPGLVSPLDVFLVSQDVGRAAMELLAVADVIAGRPWVLVSEPVLEVE